MVSCKMWEPCAMVNCRLRQSWSWVGTNQWGVMLGYCSVRGKH